MTVERDPSPDNPFIWYDGSQGGVPHRSMTRMKNGWVMCQICFEILHPDLFWADEEGIKWDVCIPCHDQEQIILLKRGKGR